MKKIVSEQIDYVPGTVRVIRRFAWWPRVVGEYKIWLRKYEAMFVFRVEDIPALINGENKTLIKKHWYLVDERII